MSAPLVAAVIGTSARPGRDVGLQAVIRQQGRDGLQFRTDERDEQVKSGLSDFFTACGKSPCELRCAVENSVDTAREGAELLAACQAGKIGIGRLDMKKCP